MEQTGELSIKQEDNFNQPLPEILNLIANKYDKNLPYHNSNHTKQVVERAFLIGQVLALDERQLKLLQIASSFHDFVCDFDVVEVEVEYQGKSLKIRKRTMRREDNENLSAQEAERWMRENGYLEEEIALVKEAIMATIPDWDQEKRTVYQPKLNENSNPVVRALCLADLGAAGMSVNDYLRDPFNLFLEEYYDFHQFILGKRDLSNVEKDFYLNKFKNFISSQANFVEGRREFFEREIKGEGIDEEKKKKLKELFSGFDKSHQQILALANEINQEDFDSLVSRFRNLINTS